MNSNKIPDSILARIKELLPGVADWQYLDVGNTSNRLFAGRDQRGQYILRVNAAQSVSFGVNREQENQVLMMIADNTWAPTVISNDPVRGFCLMAYHGEPVTDTARTRTVIFSALTELQQMVTGPWFDYAQLFAGYQAHFQAGVKESDVPLSGLSQLRQQLALLPDDRCLIHQDLHPGNVLVDNNRVVIIDWEYAGIGNAWLELANVQKHWQFSHDELRGLPICRSYTTTALQQHMLRAAECNRLLARLWYLARG